MIDDAILKNSILSIINPLLKRRDYAHIPHSIVEDIDPDNPVNYYIDLRPKVEYDGIFDRSGVFLQYINRRYGWRYYPITIFNYGIAAYQKYIETGEESYLNKAVIQAKWACRSQIGSGESMGGWNYDFYLKTYDLKEGWISCMSQGLGISLLLRMWLITKEQQLLDAAVKAFIPFTRDVGSGGVRTKYGEIYQFYEEYPSSPPSYVLNGFITALLGLRDLWIFAQHREALRCWNQGVETLEAIVQEYDLGFWSKYDLKSDWSNPASFFYHDYHILQLKLLHLLTGVEKFKDYAERFCGYSRDQICRMRALVKKIGWRLRRL